MPIYSLDGDTFGLPYTRRSNIPYEIEALTPREVWGAGNGNTTLICKVKWEDSVRWIKDMVGEVGVAGSSAALNLYRYVPEILRYNDSGEGSDSRVQFCTSIEQVAQYGNATGANMADPLSGWPATDFAKYRATWEAVPYAILDYAAPIGSLPAMVDIRAAADTRAGASELYRYCIRKRRSYTREQPTPGPSSVAGLGFYVVSDTVPKKLVPGAVLFRNVQYADITIRWLRVPVGWPPPVGYLAPNPANPWPPKFNPAATDPTTKARTRDTFQGTVNDDWFDCAVSDGLCAPPETLLYTGYSDDNKYYDAAGDWVCDIDLFFKFKGGTDATGAIKGWNHYMNSAGVWVAVTADNAPGDGSHGTAGGRKPYKTNNFNNLFDYS